MDESGAQHFPEIAEWMTPERAEYVRELRIDHGYSWRSLADACAQRWGAVWSPPWSQLAGMDLCDEAQVVLGDTWTDE